MTAKCILFNSLIANFSSFTNAIFTSLYFLKADCTFQFNARFSPLAASSGCKGLIWLSPKFHLLTGFCQTWILLQLILNFLKSPRFALRFLKIRGNMYNAFSLSRSNPHCVSRKSFSADRALYLSLHMVLLYFSHTLITFYLSYFPVSFSRSPILGPSA